MRQRHPLRRQGALRDATRRCAARPCASRPAPACSTCALDVEDGAVATVAVEMGRPRLTRGEIPMLPAGADARCCASRSTVARPRRSSSPPSRWATRTRSSSSTTDASLRTLAETLGPTLETARAVPEADQRRVRARARARRDRSGRLGARLRPHARVRHRRVRDRGRRLPGRAARARRRDARAPARRHAGHHRRQGLRRRPHARPARIGCSTRRSTSRSYR